MRGLPGRSRPKRSRRSRPSCAGTTNEEHFALIGPLHASGARVRVAETRGLTYAESLAAMLAEVGPSTRLLALSHVPWMTGNLLPAAELKAATGLPVLVDGAQSGG